MADKIGLRFFGGREEIVNVRVDCTSSPFQRRRALQDEHAIDRVVGQEDQIHLLWT